MKFVMHLYTHGLRKASKWVSTGAYNRQMEPAGTRLCIGMFLKVVLNQ